jgi:cytochrome oxidase Cu insertion factor (SCO1/SenC/PrrC family)
VTIPDVTLTDQDGKSVRFVSDLIRGKVFAISFSFTRCKGVCPLLGAYCGRLRKLLDEQKTDGVIVITVSVDPDGDTPEALATWARQFGAGPGWSLVTGPRRDVERLLKALGAFAADKNQHPQNVLIGDGRAFRFDDAGASGEVRRLGGLGNPRDTARILQEFRQASPRAAKPSPAEEYFTTWTVTGDDGLPKTVRRDIVLTDQDGTPRRFYADLLKDRKVAIHAFFSSCTGACPRMFGTASKIQALLGDRLGEDAFIISLTVDPSVDTPDRLRSYATGLHARPGWFFLTGAPADVELVVRKLHPEFTAKESHSTRFFIGNLRDHLWAKPDIASRNDSEILAAAERIWGLDHPGGTR